MLTYGPNGVSRGVATIIFSKPGSAQDALQQLNGVLVDKRPMKVRFQVIQLRPSVSYIWPGRDRCQCSQCYSCPRQRVG